MAPTPSSLLRQEVDEALEALATFVVVKAHQLMLQAVHTRAACVGRSLQGSLSVPSQPQDLALAVRNFQDAVDALAAFVTTFAKTDKFVFHLASMRRMYLDLYAISVKLDQSGGVIGTEWQKQLQLNRDKEEAELSARAAKNALPFARSMMPHEPMEALTLLKFEIDFFKPGNSVKHVASMKKVFFSVVRSSNGRVAKIPDWYIPPYAVNYSRDKVMPGSVGSAHRGVWIDRKPADGKKPERNEEGGEQEPTSYDVVVKRLLIHADAIELFRQEVEIWFNLDHPNILKLYGASHCSRPALIVVTDASHGSLVEFLAGQWKFKSFDPRTMWSYFLQTAEGLKFLHGQKTVHGNLKSGNILVTTDGIVKLADFGRGMFALQSQSLQNNKFHELGWRAPNCLKDRKFPRRPAFQDDIYSFGLCILDALVPTVSSLSAAQGSNGPKRVGDESFDPLSPKVLDFIKDENAKKLVMDMCQPNPDARPTLGDVTKRMKILAPRNPTITGVVIA
ncbi:hypothetical protein V7S43_015790 [Phytophthora oleae]|uniref:Protein kinase domain-containing protein n=1 Tax=Phytophthora oleae TaxID=2107226 RepID=A0ABD3EZT4_9STRA